MRDRILVEKELIPYAFDILLAGEMFEMSFGYNKSEGIFTVTLSRDGRVLVYGEPLVYGKRLFEEIYRSGEFPMLDIVPLDESGQECAVTWENFGETVFLTIAQGGDEDE